MYARISNLMAWRAGLLMAGCAEALARENLYPYAIYAGDRVKALSSSAELAQAYRGIHAALSNLGACQLEARVAAIGLPRNGRFRVWVDWWAELRDGSRQIVAQTVEYLCETASGSPRGEMTECTRCAMTDCAIFEQPAAMEAQIRA